MTHHEISDKNLGVPLLICNPTPHPICYVLHIPNHVTYAGGFQIFVFTNLGTLFLKILIKTPSKILRPPQNSKEYVTPLRCSAPAYVFASFYFKNIPPVGFNATYIEIFLPFTAKISHF